MSPISFRSSFSFPALTVTSRVPRLFVPAVSCPSCTYPNDEEFRFCQRCGYARPGLCSPTPQPLRAPIDLAQIEARKEALFKRKQSTPYFRQKSSLEKELASLVQNLSPPRDLQTATPHGVVSFLIWKDVRGKTKVHLDSCPAFGTKKSLKCVCPTRLAFGTVESLVGKLRAIFAALGRGSDDSGLPGYGNPAASRVVKDYLTSVREEQLQARISPSQAEPFFLTDLVAVAEHICSRLKEPGLTPKQIFILARDQAFLKVLFFAGDRAADLGRVKTKEIL